MAAQASARCFSAFTNFEPEGSTAEIGRTEGPYFAGVSHWTGTAPSVRQSQALPICSATISSVD
jgi:hypothetical protein